MQSGLWSADIGKQPAPVLRGLVWQGLLWELMQTDENVGREQQIRREPLISWRWYLKRVGLGLKWKPKMDNGDFSSPQIVVVLSGSAWGLTTVGRNHIYGLFGCHDDDNQIKNRRPLSPSRASLLSCCIVWAGQQIKSWFSRRHSGSMLRSVPPSPRVHERHSIMCVISCKRKWICWKCAPKNNMSWMRSQQGRVGVH